MNLPRVPWTGTLGKGWRRAAVINTIAITTFTLLAAILLIWSTSQSGGGINTNLIFFDGGCAKSRAMNLWLHLLLNVFSTGVMASSNFFMQVLSSPTRREVDKAHRRNVALEIGVPSLRNIFYVAWFKGACWLLFFASSLPIHLFFNSAIFATEYQGADWHLTIASEGFIDGAQYFGPGAVLWRAGAPGIQNEDERWPGDVEAGYGSVVNVTEYWDPSREAASTIEFAARSSRGWKRLEVAECLSRYVYCNAHNDFRDVVWVVKSHNASGDFMIQGNNSLGWQRNQLLAPMDLLESAFWDIPSPVQEANSLWFAANCTTSINFNIEAHQTTGCYQSCSGATGYDMSTFDSKPVESIPGNYTFDFLPGLNSYTSSQLSRLNWPGLSDPSAATLDLEYCLAQTVSTTCKVAMSNRLLLVVVLCLVIKTGLCIIVVFTMHQQRPLVVPGDAIASFICSPDEFTTGRCTLDRKLEAKGMMNTAGGYTTVAATPRQWSTKHRRRRWTSAIAKSVWARSYALFAADIIFVGVMFGVTQKTNPVNGGNQNLSESPTNGILSTTGETAGQLLSSVLTVNLPQLLLSMSYFVYNSLYTRLCAEKEWCSYGTDYYSLRVTIPQGQQRSKYRLQLPYRYSIPLIVVSIVLHWLVSNALYVFVLEGGYYWVDVESLKYILGELPSGAGTGLSDDAYVGIGYSTIALLAIFLAAVVLAVIPFILTQRTIKGPMPLGGTNSRVISAACHVPILEEVPEARRRRGSETTTTTAEQGLVGTREPDEATSDQPDAQQESESGAIQLQQLLSSHALGLSDDRVDDIDEHSTERAPNVEGYLLNISRNPVRWGAVDTSLSCDQQHAADPRDGVRHLSFGTRDHDVQEPVDGQLYA